ncbi:hypothetical protein [Cytobacillus gottheilii]|uniref:hypothetical protein n=1 Tax=Cytobacillus gottheilii TaxID=859144 RepID=UPI0009BBB107|nr:hypothetical protein [Cytobacillus gottheilii]
MYKKLTTLGLLLLFSSSCSPKEITIQEEETVPEIVFNIENEANLPDSDIKIVETRLQNAYKKITSSIKIDYKHPTEIHVILKEGNLASSGFKDTIKLYGDMDTYPIVHELSHILLGYGKNFDASSGFITQEGIAEYFQQKYGTNNFYPHHSHMRFLKQFNKVYPLSLLASTENSFELFRPNMSSDDGYKIQQIAYVQAGSFISYLIETYGMEKFESIYNEQNLTDTIETVYGKNLLELEEDWLLFLENQLTLSEHAQDYLQKMYGSFLDSDGHIFFQKN